MSTLSALEVVDKHLSEDFEQLFRQYSQFVYRTAYGVTGNAEDRKMCSRQSSRACCGVPGRQI
jgi:hypothetical protein